MSGNPGLLALLWFGKLTLWLLEAGALAVFIYAPLRHLLRKR